MSQTPSAVRRDTLPGRVVEGWVHHHARRLFGAQPGSDKSARRRHDVECHNPRGEPIEARVLRRQGGELRRKLNQGQLDAANADREREAGSADAGTQVDDCFARPCRHGSGKQYCIVTDAVDLDWLAQPQPANQHGIFGHIVGNPVHPIGALWPVGAKLVAEAGILEQLAGFGGTFLCHQDAAWQDANRPFEHAHVSIKHHVRDLGTIQKRLDDRDQHVIIGADKLAHMLSFTTTFLVQPAWATRSARHCPTSSEAPHDPCGVRILGCRRHLGAEHLVQSPHRRPCPPTIAFLLSRVLPPGVSPLAVIVPFENPSPPSIARLIGLLAADMERVNGTILSRTGSEVTMIPEVANHLIASGGKRLRPMLTLAMARLARYGSDGHVKLAAAVEFMHTATLLHDDVVDESEMRRGKLAARLLWGNEASVLVGDFLLGQAFKMMVEVGSLRSLEILSSAAAVIAEGEVMQLAAAKNTATTEDEYLSVIRAKTAELFAAACEVGPALGARPKDEQSACRSFGMNLGIAFQLVDDALDYGRKAAKLGKNVGDAFREGKITLPVVLSYRCGSEDERTFWRRTLEAGDAAEADLDQAIELMMKHRATEDTIQRARHYGAIAKDALALFPASPMKEALEETVEFCIARSN